jgi:hypothetical protein
MKWEGRVGEAALYGCGCWASDLIPASTTQPRVAVACSASGVGEQITKSMLSSATCREMLSSADEADVSARRSLDQFFAVNAREGEGSHAGFIALRATLADEGAHGGSPDAETTEGREDENEDENDDGTLIEGDLVVAHSTASMAYGFIDHRITPRVCLPGWTGEPEDHQPSALTLILTCRCTCRAWTVEEEEDETGSLASVAPFIPFGCDPSVNWTVIMIITQGKKAGGCVMS